MVTLVRAEDWHALPNSDNLPDDDLVWGCAYKIDPAYADQVKAYLDHREKDGYSCEKVDVWNIVDDQPAVVVEGVSRRVTSYIKLSLPFDRQKYGTSSDSETRYRLDCRQVYLGHPENPSFIGAEPLDELAQTIFESVGRASNGQSNTNTY